jgi:hypothetical protein
MLKCKFRIEGLTPILMHKFNGIEEEKQLKQKSDAEQAEAHAYRLPNGNLGIPCEWIRGCLIDYYILNAPPKKKSETRLQVAPRIRVEPYMLDLGIKNYIIDKRSVPSGNISRGGVRDFCVRPRIDQWRTDGMLITTLEKTVQEIRRDFEQAGLEIGIGSNRVNGFGRFKVVMFAEQSEA